MGASSDTEKARQKSIFLESLRQTPNVSLAADAAGIARWTAYRWRDTDEEFKGEWLRIAEARLDALEAALHSRALDDDHASGTTCAIFLLKAHRRNIYGDKREISGPDGGPIPLEQQLDLSKLTDDDLRSLSAIVQRGRSTTD